MTKRSAGILLYKHTPEGVRVLLVHPGGPFWATRDAGAWSMPKGECEEGEEQLAAARREFKEEIGAPAPEGKYSLLGEAKQASGKIVSAYTLESDFNLERFHSNMFEMEWPPKSGKKQEFPENDRAAWVLISAARKKLVKGQLPLLDALCRRLGIDPRPPQTSLF